MLIPLGAALVATAALVVAGGVLSAVLMGLCLAVVLPIGYHHQRRVRAIRETDPGAAQRADDAYITRWGKLLAGMMLGLAGLTIVYASVLLAKHA